MFGTFGYVSSYGVYQDLYNRTGTSSDSNISWIGSVQLFFTISMGLPAGKLLDNGYFKHSILAGTLIYLFRFGFSILVLKQTLTKDIISLFMLSLVRLDRYYQIFLSQGVGMGIGSGLIYLPSMAVQTHHWKKRRSMAMGIVITGKQSTMTYIRLSQSSLGQGSSFGGIVYPIMLNNLFNNSVGFAWGVRASGLLTLIVLGLANLLMSTGLPPLKDRPRAPATKLRDIVTDFPYMLTVSR
jgi:MFS family permease